jgi:hypothetical protein
VASDYSVKGYLPNEEFGGAAAVSGQTVVVGAPYDEGGTGAVYVFERTQSGWVQRAKLAGATFGLKFGRKVALDGNTLAVANTASVLVYVGSGSTWTLQTTLQPAGTGVDALAIQDDTCVIGSSSASARRGAVASYTRSGTAWSRDPDPTPQASEDHWAFGASVALEGSTLLVGAPESATAWWPNGGAVYAFTRVGDEWLETAVLEPSDPQSDLRFGSAVALDGEVAILGADGDDRGKWANEDEGAAYVFVHQNDTWHQVRKLRSPITGDRRYFGRRIAFDAGVAVLPIERNEELTPDELPQDFPGIAYVFWRP